MSAMPTVVSRRMERLYRTLFESLPQQVFFKDTNSVFVSVNAAFGRDLGREPQELVGRSDADFFPEDLARKYQADDQRIMASRQAESFEEQNVVAGRRRVVEVTKSPVIDEDGAVIGLLGVFSDITERREAREETRRSQAFLNSVVENLPIMLFSKRAGDLRFALWNRASEELTGLASENVVGRCDHDLFPKDEADAYAEQDRATLAGGTLVDVPEETILTAHRGARILHTRKIPILDERGVPQYLLGISEDITERKAAEEKLREFTARLEQNNRELVEFAYVASHDLQEPLRKVRAFGDRLKTRCGAALADDGRDYLERMLNAATRMQTLIDDLLSFSRVTTRARPFVPVDLNRVLREVVSDLEVRIEQTQGQVEVAELPAIDADATQMRQLFQNLVGNALKFHKKDAAALVKVYARVEAAAAGPKPRQPGHGKPRQCQLFVEDNGIGFDEKYLDRIFTVFQRLHGRAEYEGTGVGLAICRKIALRHHGDITARSRPGQGATFIVTLPLNQAKN